MIMKPPRIHFSSIRIKLIISFLSVAVPLIGLLIYNNFYAIHVVREQVSLSNKNMISLYMAQIDNNLEDVDKYLNSLVSISYETQIMARPLSDSDYILAKVKLADKLSADVLIYKVTSFFIYSSSRQDLLDIVKEENEDLAKKERIRSFIRELVDKAHAEQLDLTHQWFVQEIGDEYYLFRLQRLDELYVGSWVNIKTLMLPLNLINIGEKGSAVFATSQGEPMTNQEWVKSNGIDLSQNLDSYYLSGKKDKYLIVGEKSHKGGFSLAALIPSDTILQNLPYLRRIVVIISFLGILLIPGFLWFLRRTLLIPLNRITSVMRRVRDGNTNMRIESNPRSEEFQLFHTTFNQMMTQIEELKIHVYEEQLSKQRAELQYLQLQIKPHFFLNTLNILYNLALVQDYELIKEITLRLAKHFRYMLRSNLTFIPLNEELEHVRNYIRIHELRFLQTLDLHIDEAPTLDNVHVPPLIIQSFIENSIKHATRMTEPLSICIKLELVDSIEDPHVLITIRDSGPGFPEEVLKELHAGNRVIDDEGEHIGIWNVWHRLRLLYGHRAQLRLENTVPSGALVQIKLPLEIES